MLAIPDRGYILFASRDNTVPATFQKVTIMSKKEKSKPQADNKAVRKAADIKSEIQRLDEQYQFDIQAGDEVRHYNWHQVFNEGAVAQEDKDAFEASKGSLHDMVFTMAKCTKAHELFEADKKLMYEAVKLENGNKPIPQVVRDAFSVVLSAWKKYDISPHKCDGVSDMKTKKQAAIKANAPATADEIPEALALRLHELTALFSRASDEQRLGILDGLDATVKKYVEALGEVLPVAPEKKAKVA